MKLAQKDAHKLFRQGAIELAHVEANGMRIDVDRLDKTIEKTSADIDEITNRLKQDEVWKVWKKRFGQKANLGSPVQLATVVYDEMGYKPEGSTRLGKRPKMDAETLGKIDLPFVQDYLKQKKLDKLLGTYLKGVRREVVDGFMHPVFNLHFVKTYRSSSDSPNFQNIPIRDPKIGKLIRTCIVPRSGRSLVEIDYSAIEVRVSACYTHDERLIRYINDPTTDMHRDMACKCFKLKPHQVSKVTRYCAKNMFVFPEFYGSYYVRCSQNMWEAIDDLKLRVAIAEDNECRWCGMPCYGDKCNQCGGAQALGLKEHLAEKKIKRLGECNPKSDSVRGTFEHHIKQVEKEFWEEFSGYAAWKDKWMADYQKNGGFDLLIGFRVDGVYSRNQILNTPIQGVAFHLLLWSLITLNRWLRKNKMRTKIVGQIHDSIMADVHPDEMEDYLQMAKCIMTIGIRKHWPWIIVPLEIEAEASDVSWFDKKVIEI